MKNNLIAIGLALFTFAAFTLTSCNNDDTTAPIITLIGPSSVTVTLGSVYIDDGATAEDDEDGDLTALIITDNPVNTDSAATYTITYSVSDASGNPASATRTVIVVIVRDSWVGAFNAEHTSDNLNCAGATFLTSETITAGATANSIVIGDFTGTGDQLNATVSGQTITFSTQVVGGFTITNGQGTINDSATRIDMTFTSSDGSCTDNFTSFYLR